MNFLINLFFFTFLIQIFLILFFVYSIFDFIFAQSKQGFKLNIKKNFKWNFYIEYFLFSIFQ